MTIVVTGGTGFIGRNFITRAQDAGYDAVPLLRAGVEGNGLSHDGTFEQLTAVLRSVGATAIVHCAAAFSPNDDPDETIALVRANLELPILLLQVARFAGVTRFVNIGSLWEHAADGSRCPVNLYAATKTSFEDILAYFSREHGISSITLKLSETYGPGDTRSKLLPLIRSAVENGETLKMTAGTQTVCYCHVNDVCAAILHALRRLETDDLSHETYVVEGDEPMVLRDMIALLSSYLPDGLPVELGQAVIDGKKPAVPWIGGSRLPGWSPRVSLLKGMLDYFGKPL